MFISTSLSFKISPIGAIYMTNNVLEKFSANLYRSPRPTKKTTITFHIWNREIFILHFYENFTH